MDTSSGIKQRVRRTERVLRAREACELCVPDQVSPGLFYSTYNLHSMPATTPADNPVLIRSLTQ